MMRPEPPALQSMAAVLKLAYGGHDLVPRHRALCDRVQAAPNDPAGWMDLSVLAQLLGDQAGGVQHQARALALTRLYRSARPASSGALRILAFLAPGDIGTNMPIEFLLQGTDTILYTLYVEPGRPLPDAIPPHDVAIVTMGESDSTAPLLRQIARDVSRWPCPVLNDPLCVLDLSRERLAPALAGIAGMVMQATVRIDRRHLAELADGRRVLRDIVAETLFPIIVRPVGSHAGRGLEKLDEPSAIGAYLETYDDSHFTLSGYTDYRSADGLFRKYRIVWVGGTAFPCHMAICEDWKVWYLNADMEANAANRAEEARFMTDFAAAFAPRHAGAMHAVSERLGLDYVGIDCAETRDGKLLIFEGDISLIVHDLDSPAIFPYKPPAMARLFAAFQTMLRDRANPVAALEGGVLSHRTGRYP